MTTVIGLDIGATRIKGAALDMDAGTVGYVMRERFPPFATPWPARELDPEAVVAVVRRMLDDLVATHPEAEALLLCGQMHGVVLAREGRAVTPWVSWQDARAEQDGSFSRLRGRLPDRQYLDLGAELRPGIGLSTLYRWRERGELPPGATPLSIADFVAMRLCDEKRPFLHPSQAAGLGARNLARAEWDRGLLREIGLDSLAWPLVLQSPQVVGVCRVRDACLPVWPAVGDHQCALLGAGIGPGDLSINIGTGCQVAALVSKPDPGLAQCRPWFDADRCLRTVTHLPGGRAVDAMARLLGSGALPAADDADLAGLLVAPGFWPQAFGPRGAVSCMTEENMTAGALMRATLRGIVANCGNASGLLQADCRRVVVSGGLPRASQALRDELTARFGPWVAAQQHPETLAGLLALGRSWIIRPEGE